MLVATTSDAETPGFLPEHADVSGCRIVLPKEVDSVLLGSAILGAVAAGVHETVLDGMSAMSGAADVIEPVGGATKRYHDAKHRVFHRLYEEQMAYRALMQDG